MSALTIATIAFFGVYGITHFFPIPHAGVILAVAAIVIAVLNIL